MNSDARPDTSDLETYIDPERQARRLDAIDRWIEHVRETPASVWGAELNALVNAQVESAQAVSDSRGERPRFDGFDPEAIREAGRDDDQRA